jgi:uncharacterized membrane protein
MDGLGLLVGIVAFVLALVALKRNSRLEAAIAQLRTQVDMLAGELRHAGPAPAEEGRAAQDQPSAAPQPVDLETGAQPSNWVTATPDMEPKPAVEPEPLVEPVDVARPASRPPAGGDMEQALASRWFVWIGGVAIAVGGLLFVKYAYDQSLIAPAMQIVLGLIAGAVLVLAGEWVRRKASTVVEQKSSYVPAALSAAGLATLFASIFAAYALYELIAPLTAFGGLAAVALGALLLSGWQGPLVAALGLVGSYITPAIIPSADPNAWGFFPYLLVILAASFAVLRVRQWWWLGYAALAGAFAWAALWILWVVFVLG